MHASSSMRCYLAHGMLVLCQHRYAGEYLFSSNTELTNWYIIIEATYSFVHEYCVVFFARASLNNSISISLRAPTDSQLNFPLPIFHPPTFNWYPLNKNVFIWWYLVALVEWPYFRLVYICKAIRFLVVPPPHRNASSYCNLSWICSHPAMMGSLLLTCYILPSTQRISAVECPTPCWFCSQMSGSWTERTMHARVV